MSQPTQSTPIVSVDIAGSRQKVNLRDYLNARVAPFLKQALTESLDVETQYPLQWLGERLIQQSLLYEANPDSTNIRERFLYEHDGPLPRPGSSAVADLGSPVAEQAATARPLGGSEETSSTSQHHDGLPTLGSDATKDDSNVQMTNGALDENTSEDAIHTQAEARAETVPAPTGALEGQAQQQDTEMANAV